MFSFYGLSGLDFRGTLEQLGQVRGVAATGTSRAIARVGDEHLTTFVVRHRAPRGENGQTSEEPPEEARSGAGQEGGVQAYQDMLRVDQERGPLYRADQIMSREVVTLGADDPVQGAWQTLRQHGIHQAPVLDASLALVGLVTERDLLTALNLDGGQIQDVLPRRVADVMTSPILSADPDTDIRRVARAMLEFSLAAMPVVSEAGSLVGLVTRGDVLRAVVADPPLSLWG